MAARLTDKWRKAIIAERVQGRSLRDIAREYGVAASTVKRVCESDTETVQLATQKKEENTAEILAHMETKKDAVNRVIDRYLVALLDEERIEKATPAQLTTAMGTLIDKWAPRDRVQPPNEDNMRALADIINKPAPNRNIKDFEE